MLYGICFWLLNKNKDNVLLDNSVRDRYWHFKDSKPFYILLGSSRRFFEEELLYEERNINM